MIVERIALSMEQIEQYDPPPNPAKITDTRAGPYIREFGREAWELDALEPSVLADLVRDAVLSVRDDALWEEAVDQEEADRGLICGPMELGG